MSTVGFVNLYANFAEIKRETFLKLINFVQIQRHKKTRFFEVIFKYFHTKKIPKL